LCLKILFSCADAHITDFHKTLSKQLQQAVLANDIADIKELVRIGADPSVAVSTAIESKVTIETLDYLLSLKGNPESYLSAYKLRISNPKYIETPLYQAVCKGDLAKVTLLIKYGANVATTHGDHTLIVSSVVHGGNPELTEFLLENGGVHLKKDLNMVFEYLERFKEEKLTLSFLSEFIKTPAWLINVLSQIKNEMQNPSFGNDEDKLKVKMVEYLARLIQPNKSQLSVPEIFSSPAIVEDADMEQLRKLVNELLPDSFFKSEFKSIECKTVESNITISEKSPGDIGIKLNAAAINLVEDAGFVKIKPTECIPAMKANKLVLAFPSTVSVGRGNSMFNKEEDFLLRKTNHHFKNQYKGRAAKVGSNLFGGAILGYSVRAAIAGSVIIAGSISAAILLGACTAGGAVLLLLLAWAINRYRTGLPGFFPANPLPPIAINDESKVLSSDALGLVSP